MIHHVQSWRETPKKIRKILNNIRITQYVAIRVAVCFFHTSQGDLNFFYFIFQLYFTPHFFIFALKVEGGSFLLYKTVY